MLRRLPILLVLLAACATDVRVEGAVQEPREGVMAVRWGPAGSGLVHGEGVASGGRFWVDVDRAPPHAAFHQGVAVGELVLLGQGGTVRLGAPLDDVRGLARDVALVFRGEGLGDDTHWASTFPAGLSCARPVEQGWAPVACATLEPLRFD